MASLSAASPPLAFSPVDRLVVWEGVPKGANGPVALLGHPSGEAQRRRRASLGGAVPWLFGFSPPVREVSRPPPWSCVKRP